MKPKEKEERENDESWGFIIVVLIVCITIIFSLRMYVELSVAHDMIEHYTLRGKDVIIENEQLVFIN